MASAPGQIALGRMDIECRTHTVKKTVLVLRLEWTGVILVRCHLRSKVEKPAGRIEGRIVSERSDLNHRVP
jgi:hypothetical protein